MLKVLVACVLLCKSFCGISQCSQNDKDVYSIIIDSVVSPQKNEIRVRTKLIAETESSILVDLNFRTPSGENWLYNTKFDAKTDSTMRRLVRGYYNSRLAGVIQDTCLPVNGILIHDQEARRIFKSGKPKKGWKKFYRKFPAAKGVITFSRVYYPEEKNYAVVFYNVSRNSLDGYGALAILRNIHGIWRFWHRVDIYVN